MRPTIRHDPVIVTFFRPPELYTRVYLALLPHTTPELGIVLGGASG